ncbi:LOW QUALITY PROTEIN: hypothetical protein PHMEG_00016659 [Phytophthora megakarya]|uniref:DUF7869 domain-containing protein n=1 Tax=Phytophthora megakarya TaxID=4795 RepID=A0A225VYR5_9STRA|nr:LOW QUALITY PROTEIN: hypothetical protein PHMEG_00016659 [Phytophthora megakarya]
MESYLLRTKSQEGKHGGDIHARLVCKNAKHLYDWKRNKALARADNCGGQVKNNHVLQFLLCLVHTGSLKGATLSFLVKGHTKNQCDRHFGYIKRHYAKRDLWI